MKIRHLNETMKPLSPATLAEWEKQKAELIETVKFCSSYDLLKQDAPLNAEIFDPVEFDGFVVEKVIFESLPGFYVTGNLYRPKDTGRKYPAVLNPHGHWSKGRVDQNELGRLPQRCANQAMRGMVAFIYDMIGYADNTQIAHNGFSPEWERWNYGRFSLQLNNSRKAIDFLCSLPYVDAERIGCTGCSGGGTQTYFIAALDRRVKCAAPINMASVRMQGGCVCENQAFLRTDYNNIDYTMTIAPRPLFLSGSDGDWTVTSEAVEFPAVEKIYRLYGAEDKFGHFYRSAPHCYDLPTRERVYDFLCRNFGIENPYDREIDMEFDTDAFRITSLPDCPGFIHNDEELFALVKSVMKENLAKLTAEERQNLVRRVYVLDKTFELDIPYYVDDEIYGKEVIRLGDCPASSDFCGVKYPHCYNTASDTKRVNALIRLFDRYPDAEFTASGKTAALCELARKLTDRVKLTVTEPDASDIHIPGSALLENL